MGGEDPALVVDGFALEDGSHDFDGLAHRGQRQPGVADLLHQNLRGSEAEIEAVRRVEGIPLHNDVVEYIRDLCSELSLPCSV